MQVGFRGGELLPVPVEHRPVGQYPLHPNKVVGAAEHGQGGLIVGKRLIEPAKLIQDRAPLRPRPCPRHASQT